MKHKFLSAALCLVSGVVAIHQGCSTAQPKEEETSAVVPISREEVILKGAHLVDIMGCNDCHSPKVFTEQGPVPDPDRLLSGHPADMALPPVDKSVLSNWVLFGMHNTNAVGPWGVSFAGNLTSDATGIGSWSLEQFKRAMTQGKYKGLENGRMLLPPMPWPNYRHLSDEELEAIFAYLQSTRPVKNVVPAPIAPNEL